MISYNEAKDLFNRQVEYGNNLCISPNALTKEQEEKILEVNIATRRLQEELLSYPHIFKKARFWMIDIIGGSNENFKDHLVTRESLQAFVESPLEAMSMLGGKIFDEVKDWLLENKYILTDSGGGLGSWHLGCHCTNAESHSLCTNIRKKFCNHFDSGYLKLSRKYWGMVL
jgi:hypothetical protein